MNDDPNNPISALPISASPNYVNPQYVTPIQAAQMRLYANSLLNNAQTMPVHNWAQGLHELTSSALGGYYSGVADRQQRQLTEQGANNAGVLTQALTGGAPIGGGGGTGVGGMPLSYAEENPAATPSATTPQGNYPNTPAGHEAFIRDYVSTNYPNKDPNFVAKVGHAEGLDAWGPQNPNAASKVDLDSNGKPFSFGDFQLNVRNGLGNEARDAGIEPTDPNQWQAADKFAIDHMMTQGMQPWRGDPAVKAAGLGKGNWQAPSKPPTSSMVMAYAGEPTPPTPPVRPPVAAPPPNMGNVPANTVDLNLGPASSAPSLAPAPQAPMMPVGPNATSQIGTMPPNMRGAPIRVPPRPPALPPAISPPGQGGNALGAINSFAPTGDSLRSPPPGVNPYQVAALRGVDPRALSWALADPSTPPELRTALINSMTPGLVDTGPGMKGVGSPFSMLNGVPPTPATNVGFQTPITAGPVTTQNITFFDPRTGTYRTTAIVPNQGMGGGTPPPTAPAAAPPSGGAPSPAPTPAGREVGAPPPPPGTGTMFDTTNPFGKLVDEGQRIEARGRGYVTQQDRWNTAVNNARDSENAARQQEYTLNSLQSIIDKNGGKLPTGHGADDIAAAGSIGELISSLTGHKIDEDTSTVPSIQLFKKYGTQLASGSANKFNANPTNFDLATFMASNPSSELAGTTNIHLVDNLSRLNKLEQKYYQELQKYGADHNNDLTNFNEYFNHVIGHDQENSPNAQILSKFPVKTVHYKNQDWNVYQSTDKSGYTYRPAGTSIE